MRSILERPSVNLLVLGTLFAAYTGRRTFQSRRREAFLGEVNGIANLRLSAEEALVEKLHRLCEFFAARECILLCTSLDSSGYLVYRVRGNGESAAQAATRLSDAAARALLELPDGLATAWSGRQTEGGRLGAACRRLANLLEAPSFATVPYTRDQQIVGRIFLVAERSRFTRRDLGLLTEVVEQVNAVVDFHAALDELKRGAARAERSRLSRDIHDTTIQPFLGLKFGIEALYRGLDPGSPVAQQVKQLLDFSSTSVEDLRNYAAHLRGSDGVPREQALPTKLQTQAERYRAFWGIEVDLRIAPDPPVSGELAAEAYQMACEALSNVRRHTQARRAFVAVRCDGACVLLEVGNERSADNPARPFTPRSIADRASALGGRVDVMLDAQGHDVVQVSLPMEAKR